MVGGQKIERARGLQPPDRELFVTNSALGTGAALAEKSGTRDPEILAVAAAFSLAAAPALRADSIVVFYALDADLKELKGDAPALRGEILALETSAKNPEAHDSTRKLLEN